MKELKKNLLINLILSNLSRGKTPSQISKENNISIQNLSYYLKKLKERRIIKKIGYGVWEVKNQEVVAKQVRGHSFMWKIRLPKHYNWKKILENKKFKYKKIKKNTFSILFKDRRIWLGKKNIIIYEPESFFGKNSIDTRKYAINRLLEILGALQAFLGINLEHDEGFWIKVARQHYSLIKNALAIQCNKEGKKIEVYNREGLWFLIDNSYNLEEAETVHPKTALTDNIGIQRYFNEHKETKFQVTPKFIIESINQVTENQKMFAENFKTHVKAIRDLSKGVNELVKITKEVREQNKQLKQRRLKEWGI